MEGEATELDSSILFGIAAFIAVGFLIIVVIVVYGRTIRRFRAEAKASGLKSTASVISNRTSTSTSSEGGTSTSYYLTISFTTATADGKRAKVTRELRVKGNTYTDAVASRNLEVYVSSSNPTLAFPASELDAEANNSCSCAVCAPVILVILFAIIVVCVVAGVQDLPASNQGAGIGGGIAAILAVLALAAAAFRYCGRWFASCTRNSGEVTEIAPDDEGVAIAP